MLSLCSAIFVASLLGSTHCVGMCGAFVAFAVGAGGPAPAAQPSRLALNAAYNLGRLATYITLGVIAGSLGALFDMGGTFLGIQRVAACTAGALMVAFGVVAVLRHAGVHIARRRLPARYTRLVQAAHARAFDLPPLTRAAAIGLLTTLLPCGWLYAFVIASAGTASPFWAALAMAAFWAGTLPALGALGMSIKSITGPFARRLPLATSLLLVGAGLWTVLGRLPVIPMALSAAVPAVAPANADELLQAAHDSCPYCNSESAAP